MKVIDAFWDSRSLGERCSTLLFDPSDERGIIAEAMKSTCEYNLITASVPLGNIVLSFELEEAGFRFIETKMCFEHDLKHVILPEIGKRFQTDIIVKTASDGETQHIYEFISEGLFTTDKIALNPRFGVKIAGKRYVNWISDEKERGAQLFAFFYKEVLSGFFIYKEPVPKTVYPFLAGLFPGKYERMLGVNLIYSSLSLAKERKYHRFITEVSSNNLPIIRINELLGMKIYDIQYIFMLDKKQPLSA